MAIALLALVVALLAVGCYGISVKHSITVNPSQQRERVDDDEREQSP